MPGPENSGGAQGFYSSISLANNSLNRPARIIGHAPSGAVAAGVTSHFWEQEVLFVPGIECS